MTTKHANPQRDSPLTRVFAAVIRYRGLMNPRVPTMFTPSSEACCLNPARLLTRPWFGGPLLGLSLTTGQIVCHSLHDLYEAGVSIAPNAVIVGGMRRGKSSLVKTVYVLRALAFGHWAAVFDRKNMLDFSGGGSGGEYIRLAQAISGTVITLNRTKGLGAIVNILDPQISPEGSDTTGVGQDDLLRMVTETALGRAMTPEESKALRTAHSTVLATIKDTVPTIHDLITALLNPNPQVSDAIAQTVGIEKLTAWGEPIVLALDEYVSGDLSGLIDGESVGADGQPLDFSNPLLVFDTSGLGEGSRALSLMMAVVAAYVQARWAKAQGRKKILIIEEAYTNARLTGVPAILRAIAKRGTASGTAVVTVLHHLSDIPEGSDMWALVRETDVVHLFAQDKADDADHAMEFFNLPTTLRDTIKSLSRGVHILKVGERPVEVVRHIRSRWEESFTNTDDAMTGLPSEILPDLDPEPLLLGGASRRVEEGSAYEPYPNMEGFQGEHHAS